MRAEPRAELMHYLLVLGERLDGTQAGAILAAVLGGASATTICSICGRRS
ncbi:MULTISPECIES: hypothetical protein [unclassified Streptomyces]